MSAPATAFPPHPQVVRTVGELLRTVPLLAASTTCAAVAEQFAAQPELPAFVVRLGEARFALVDRADYLPRFLQRFNREVFSRQPIVALAALEPLVLPDDTPVEQAATLITAQFPEALKSSFIVTRGGEYGGIVPGVDLMRAVALAAEQASVAKSSFLANMSHEIRTPLHAVIGTLELLGGTPLDADQAGLVRTAKVSAQALLDIVGDLLDLSKIQADRFELERTPTEIRRVVGEACAIAAPRAAEKRLRLLHSVAADVPASIDSDPLRLRQVLVNFIGNAVKFTESGGVFVSVRALPGPARLRCEVRDTGCGFNPARAAALFEPFVQEDASTTRRFGGTGLGLAISRRIVQMLGGSIGCSSEPGLGACFWCEIPVTAAVPAPAPAAPLAGTRVVLAGTPGPMRAAVAGLLAELGAAVDAVAGSAVAQAAGILPATAVVVLAPAAEQDAALEWIAAGAAARELVVLAADAGAAFGYRAYRAGASRVLGSLQELAELAPIAGAELPAAAPAETPEPVAPAGFGDRSLAPLLVLDDTATNRELAARQLARLGLSSDTAANGQEGLHLAGSRRYALILVDGSMPVMDGFEFARRWRSQEAASGLGRIPLVAMTADAMAGAAERFLAAGMDDYLAKPVTLHKLHEVLSRWLPGAPAEPAVATATVPWAQQGVAAIDRAMLAELLGEADPAALAGLLQVFAAEFEPLLQDLQSAADRAALRRAAHAARSAAASAGAAALAAALAGIESQAESGADAELKNLLQAARGEFDRVRAELAAAPQRVSDAAQTIFESFLPQ